MQVSYYELNDVEETSLSEGKIEIPAQSYSNLPGEGGRPTVGPKGLAEESPLSARKVDR